MRKGNHLYLLEGKGLKLSARFLNGISLVMLVGTRIIFLRPSPVPEGGSEWLRYLAVAVWADAAIVLCFLCFWRSGCCGASGPDP